MAPADGRAVIGTVFATDYTNASHTLLFDFRARHWDEALGELFGVPMKALPEVRESASTFGETDAGRTELREPQFGQHPRRAKGKVVVNGRDVWFQKARQEIDAGGVLAPEDRKRQGLVLSLSVAAI